MTVNLDDLMEVQFYMTYYANISISEFNDLSTYEYRQMLKRLIKQKEREAEARNPPQKGAIKNN